jgi:hypothetical protein
MAAAVCRHRPRGQDGHAGGRPSLPYGKLVLATGSKPLKPPFPGGDLPGVATFRDTADVGDDAGLCRARRPHRRHRRRPARARGRLWALPGRRPGDAAASGRSVDGAPARCGGRGPARGRDGGARHRCPAEQPRPRVSSARTRSRASSFRTARSSRPISSSSPSACVPTSISPGRRGSRSIAASSSTMRWRAMTRCLRDRRMRRASRPGLWPGRAGL